MKDQTTYKVIGMMSGTSLDGLDIACCTFRKTKKGWAYKIEEATTQKYSPEWTKKLSTAHTLSGEELHALDAAYGELLGLSVSKFMSKHKLKVHFIASHGHTIFHQPERKFTYQIGSGNMIHTVTKKPVVYDFRSLDVSLNGEGAPLVPAGDKFLFSEYDVCLNLGGIANLSHDLKGKRIAYDICFNNMGLNYLMNQIGKEYDAEGALSSEGNVDEGLLKQLTAVYRKSGHDRPSLGREGFEKSIQPLIDNPKIELKDKLCTLTESAAIEIAQRIISAGKNPKVLCTGGGAFNSFLISRILEHLHDKATLIIPDEEIIKFKEAMVFAFLGVLRVRGEVNCLRSVTGADRDSSSGVMVGF